MSESGDGEVLAEGRFVRLVRRDGWEFAERTTNEGVVAVVAVNARDELVLVEQYRPPVGRNVIELPAGLTGDQPEVRGEDPAEAARRELLEETGYRAERLERLGEGPSTPGLCTEVTQFYRAHSLERVDAGGGVGDEAIRVHEVPLRELRPWLDGRIEDGLLIDPKILAGLFLARIQA